jgi:hypothetical protein
MSFKKDEHNIKSNCRPVSLLPSLSKLCEKIIFVRLYNYLVLIGLLHNVQSVRLSSWPLNCFATNICCSSNIFLLRGRKELRAVFIDISKAFDKVSGTRG